jgi:hypothetical protein
VRAAIRHCGTDLDQPPDAGGRQFDSFVDRIALAPQQEAVRILRNRSPGTRMTTAEGARHLTDCWEVVFHVDDQSGSAPP